jgi:hypothetical protein
MVNATHGRDVWAQSPWVWRIEAQICEKPYDPTMPLPHGGLDDLMEETP